MMPVAVATGRAGHCGASRATHTPAAGAMSGTPDRPTYVRQVEAFSERGTPGERPGSGKGAVASTQAPTQTGAFRAGHGGLDKTFKQEPTQRERRQLTIQLPTRHTNLKIAFRGPKDGVHSIYGPNEAGLVGE
jgi:hypothetical protein